MRLNITDNKEHGVPFLFDYLTSKIIDRNVKIILNGREKSGVITEVEMDTESYNYIRISMEDKIFEIPFSDGSKVRFDREIFYFETQSHTTLIYI